MDRLHPDTMQTLRQLIKLHGAEKLIAAIRAIEKEPEPAPLDELIGKPLTETDL